MRTISAKELRTDLANILARVNAGEEIVVTHRFHKPVIIKNVEPLRANNNKVKLPGVMAYMKATKKPPNLDPSKSTKDLYHEILDKEYGL